MFPIADRRRFYPNGKGGVVFDDLPDEEKRKVEKWEKDWGEIFVDLLGRFNRAINEERNANLRLQM